MYALKTILGIGLGSATYLIQLQEKPSHSEARLQQMAFAHIHLDRAPPLDERYLVPNEYPPHDMQKYYQSDTKGVHVCTGTERLFTNASLCPQRDKIIGIDLDPQVVAYNHFNVLLLKVSTDLADYLSLVKTPPFPNSHHQQEKLDLLRRRVIKSPHISQAWKRYYLENMERYSKVFYQAKGSFDVNNKRYGPYHRDAATFHKLQQYAVNDQFAFLCRSINDLSFLQASSVAEIDTSNICDYSFIAPRLAGNDNVRIIWTNVGFGDTSYHSYIHHPLTARDHQRFDSLLDSRTYKDRGPYRVDECLTEKDRQLAAWANTRIAFKQAQPLDNPDEPFLCYTPEKLKRWKTHRRDQCLRKIMQSLIYWIETHQADLYM